MILHRKPDLLSRRVAGDRKEGAKSRNTIIWILYIGTWQQSREQQYSKRASAKPFDMQIGKNCAIRVSGRVGSNKVRQVVLLVLRVHSWILGSIKGKQRNPFFILLPVIADSAAAGKSA